MASVNRSKILCPFLDQRCWVGGASSFPSKRDVPRSPQSLIEAVFRETEAPSYLPLRLCRPFHRARDGFQIALRSTTRRLKIQDA